MCMIEGDHLITQSILSLFNPTTPHHTPPPFLPARSWPRRRRGRFVARVAAAVPLNPAEFFFPRKRRQPPRVHSLTRDPAPVPNQRQTLLLARQSSQIVFLPHTTTKKTTRPLTHFSHGFSYLSSGRLAVFSVSLGLSMFIQSLSRSGLSCSQYPI